MIEIKSNPSEFTVENGELKKFSGQSNCLDLPSGISRIGDLAFFRKSHIHKVEVQPSRPVSKLPLLIVYTKSTLISFAICPSGNCSAIA